MSGDAAYPPQTAEYMSWSTIRFINRPSPRVLAWSCGGLLALLGLAAATLPFVKVDLRVPAQGSVAADPVAVPAAAREEGPVDARLVEPGAAVTMGQPIAVLNLGPGGERLPQILAGLARNPAVTAALSASRRSLDGLEAGAELESFPDAAVRERAAALDDATRKLEQALRGRLEYATAREELLNATVRLQGALREYIERHTVRAPAAGTLLQYDAPPHGLVSRGQAVATILPDGSRLIARLIVDPQHAADLAVGQTVRYRLAAYPYQRYGLFEGRVLRVEQTTDAQRGLLYVVRASIEPPLRLSPPLAGRVRLLMGMEAQASVIAGRRRLYELALGALLGRY